MTEHESYLPFRPVINWQQGALTWVETVPKAVCLTSSFYILLRLCKKSVVSTTRWNTALKDFGNSVLSFRFNPQSTSELLNNSVFVPWNRQQAPLSFHSCIHSFTKDRYRCAAGVFINNFINLTIICVTLHNKLCKTHPAIGQGRSLDAANGGKMRTRFCPCIAGSGNRDMFSIVTDSLIRVFYRLFSLGCWPHLPELILWWVSTTTIYRLMPKKWYKLKTNVQLLLNNLWSLPCHNRIL